MPHGEIVVVAVLTAVWLLTLILAIGSKAREDRRP